MNQENWSRYPLENLTKVILVAYRDRYRLEEAKSLVGSLQNEIVKVYTQNYLDRAEFGMGSGMAEAIKNFVKEYPADEIQQIVIDEHLTTKQIRNLEKITELQVIDRERLILNIFLRELLQPNQTSRFNSQK